MKTTKLTPIFCPQLKKEISHGECYETRQGIEVSVLEELGVDWKTAMEICDNCEVAEQEPVELKG